MVHCRSVASSPARWGDDDWSQEQAADAVAGAGEGFLFLVTGDSGAVGDQRLLLCDSTSASLS
jgi:hypothetical protein